MKYKNFENQISEAFRQDSAAVDTDALLSSLGIPVAVEKKDKALWWVFSALALLSVLLVGVYFCINGSSATGVAIKDIPVAISTQNEFNNNSNDVLVVSENESKKAADENETATNLAVNESTEVSNFNSENTFFSSTNVSSQNKVKNSQELVALGIVTEKELGTVKDEMSYSTVTARQNTSQANNMLEFRSTSKATLDFIPSANNVVNETSKKKDTEFKSRNLLNDIFSINTLEGGLISQKEYPGLADPECPSFSYRIPWNIALLAEVGVMKPLKELENTNGGRDSIFALREMNENSKEAIQLGLHVKVSRGNNPLYVRGGIAYTRIAEQMTEEYDYTEQDTTRGVISITESMDGDTITRIYGDIISETRYTGRTVKHYFLHLWDLPVAVGYELPVGGSYYVGGEIGAQINFRTSGTGFIFRDVNDYADLSEVTTKETKVGMSYFGGLHFGKHLSKRSSIQLSARFRYYPSTFSTVDPNIKQRYNLAGLHAGYVFRF